MVVEHIDNKAYIDFLTIKPTLTIDYRWLSNITFDIELSTLYTHEFDPPGSDTTDTFFRLGYRYDF